MATFYKPFISIYRSNQLTEVILLRSSSTIFYTIAWHLFYRDLLTEIFILLFCGSTSCKILVTNYGLFCECKRIEGQFLQYNIIKVFNKYLLNFLQLVYPRVSYLVILPDDREFLLVFQSISKSCSYAEAICEQGEVMKNSIFPILDRRMLVQLLELCEEEQWAMLHGFQDRTACILQQVHEHGLQSSPGQKSQSVWSSPTLLDAETPSSSCTGKWVCSFCLSWPPSYRLRAKM